MRRALVALLITGCGTDGVMVMQQQHVVSTHDAGTVQRDAGVIAVPDAGTDDLGCTAGQTRSCYSGNAANAGVGACALGIQTCEGVELPTWGDCVGSVLPGAETCNGVDDDCNGTVDEGLVQACSNSCNSGTQACTNGAWTACSAAACMQAPCIISPSLTVWQINDGEGPTCWPQSFSQHGEVGEYQYSTIPPETDPSWAAHAAPNISFSDRSTMCGNNGAPDLCACLAGGDFTYFQTSFDLPVGFNVTSLSVNIADVDDGVRVSIFNSAYPNGISGGYAYLGGGSTSDFAQYVAPGKNRIVLTHIDDCCSERRIADATISLNGGALNACP